MLNEGETVLQTAVRQWAKNRVLEVGYRDLEQTGEFPWEFLRELSKLGFMGMSFPKKYGGDDASTVETSIVAAELAFAWPSLHLIWSANASLAGYPVMRFGENWQKQKYLPLLSSGELLGCYALTEPDAGSDAANIQLSAKWNAENYSWILNGTKTYITNAQEASVAVVFARVSRKEAEAYLSSRLDVGGAPRMLDLNNPTWGKRHGGITAFIVRSMEPGLKMHESRGKITVSVIPKWGFVSCPFADVVFDNVEVGSEAVLGEIGSGFGVAMETLNNGRINIAAQSVGIARRALYEAEKYGSQRMAFDTPIIKMSVQARRLAGLRKKVGRAWELTVEASRKKDSGADYRTEAAEAKLFASETAVECAMFNYRLHGGMGYTKECIAMSILHDALATVTYEGTSDIQRLTIKRGAKSSPS